ncbi:alpha/beta hydrolase [Pseudoalteromonas citrea]|uniref:Alpha/beta hydrolase n=1 Tax=Pseudoalteromonas citrea TaxID=43655 RepID=A0A5S3XMH0_9GAMM|nr:alpha/beta fold hydrolase [Pseudoalteromonas citrea]TMP39062.1 alpha/beta hydrolase [Pseudoalteromonas citrea]TMP57111.1 alpha/beta hydrolase [Pseudoalteromonas citrea]
MKSTILLLMLISFSALSTDNLLKPTKSGLYDVGGFNLYLECYENDKPQLILEQGFGLFGSDGVWLENIKRLKHDFSICLYDRAGLGKSEQGKVPFTINDMVSRLRNLLSSADVKPPYYFAGGSYASYIINGYNNLHSEEVLGAVLIDPPPFGYFYTMGTRWPKNFKTKNEKLERFYKFEQSVYDPMFKKVPENVDHMKTYNILVGAGDFGNKPIIVVRSQPVGKRYDPPFVPDEIANTMDTLYANAESYFKSLSTNSRVIYSQSEKHHLHISDPDLIVKSIKDLVGK